MAGWQTGTPLSTELATLGHHHFLGDVAVDDYDKDDDDNVDNG